MSRIWDFHGGIHPPENKQQSLHRGIQTLPLPKRLILPMQQHIGSAAEPLVQVGERVLKGQRIAEPSSRVSIYMHAPTSGTVVEIGDYPIPHPSGMSDRCIVIEPDGKDEWIELKQAPDYRHLKKSDIAEIIRCAGIAGMGGAGFPTEIKLHLSDDHIVNTLIINGVECEPYITADDMLMRERAKQIIGGIEIASQLIKPTHILIGIEDNKPEAARAMQAAVSQSALNIEVIVIPTKYPSGGERQLIQILTGIEVPHGHLPADIGIVMQNVGTMAAVYDAVCEGKPLISRITTLTGSALAQPGNVEVLLGTPIDELLSFGACNEQQLSRLVMGGPMMGFTLEDPSVPVIKTTNCIIAGSDAEFPVAPPAQNCIRCGACEQACPVELLPQQLFWFAKAKEFDKANNYNLMDCIECGACSYVCPSHIPLVQYYRFAKGEVRKEQQEHLKSEQARIRFEARQARLEAAEQEKEARRKARAEAAAKAQAVKKTDTAVALSSPEDELKRLKTEAAVARTKLKKAEKALAQAQESGSDSIAALESAVQASQNKAQESEQALAAAEQKVAELSSTASSTTASPAAAPKSASEEQAEKLKALKETAEKARTKVTKTEQTLADAKAKNTPNVDKLTSSLAMLKSRAEEAEAAYQQAKDNSAAGLTDSETTSRRALNTVSEADIKELKTAAAVARTKVKKTEKALAAAREQNLDAADELEKTLVELQEKAEAAQQALEQAQTPEIA